MTECCFGLGQEEKKKVEVGFDVWIGLGIYGVDLGWCFGFIFGFGVFRECNIGWSVWFVYFTRTIFVTCLKIKDHTCHLSKVSIRSTLATFHNPRTINTIFHF